jgi:hypothetical protein
LRLLKYKLAEKVEKQRQGTRKLILGKGMKRYRKEKLEGIVFGNRTSKERPDCLETAG